MSADLVGRRKKRMDRYERREEPLNPNVGQRAGSGAGTGYGSGQGGPGTPPGSAGMGGPAYSGGMSGAGYAGQTGGSSGMAPGTESREYSHGEAMAHEAQETFEQVKDAAQETVGTVMQQAQEQVSLRLTSGLDQAAGLLGNVAEAVESVGRQLRQNDQGMLAEYTTRAAHQIDRVADYLEENDIEDMVSEVERFARRQPAVFLGGTFTLGLLAMRFLRSSAPRSRPGFQPRRLNTARPTRSRLNRPVSAYETASPTTGYRYGTSTPEQTGTPSYPAGGMTGMQGSAGTSDYRGTPGTSEHRYSQQSTGHQSTTGSTGPYQQSGGTGYQGAQGSGQAMHRGQGSQGSPHESNPGTERGTDHESGHTFNPGV